jgi:hypothetical protein
MAAERRRHTLAEDPKMIELVIIYCLATDQNSCVEKRKPFESSGDPVACMMSAQMYAQEYLEEHPKWRLARWKCEVNVPEQEPT